MIATIAPSRLGAAQKTFRPRPLDRSAAHRNLQGSWKFLLVLLGLVFSFGLVLQIRVLSKHSDAPSFERQHFQRVNLPNDVKGSNERGTTTPIDDGPKRNASNWNRVLFTGSFGFGHRMSKLSAAIHLVASTKFHRYIPLVQVQWGICPGGIEFVNDSAVDIFAYLFNSTEIEISSIESNSGTADNPLDPVRAMDGKVLWIRNDVAGYYAGQSYKNAGLSLNYSLASKVFHDKLRWDHALYKHLFLSKRFIGFYEIQQYQKQHRWDSFFVMGVHVRAGNGEQNHFTSAQRNVFLQQPAVIHSIAQSIRQLYNAMKKQYSQPMKMKAPLVFLATDTEYYIDALRQELSSFCDVIVYHHQPRVPSGHGVSYETNWTHSDPQTCLQGWHGAAMDMMLLSLSDVLVATSRSTFTQIVPASIIFHRASDHAWKYCEMDLFSSSTSTGMTCFRDQSSWLFRFDDSTWHTFCIPKNTTSGNQSNRACEELSLGFPVAQKLMVHFPDISKPSENDRMYRSAIDFLQSSDPLFPNETLFYYGKKYNPNYRRSRKNEVFLANWTW